MPSTQAAHPIFSFADGEMGPFSNALIRGIERISGQPKIRKLYFDYVDEQRPFDSFWSDALERLNISVDLHRDFGAEIPRQRTHLDCRKPSLWCCRRPCSVCPRGAGQV